MIEISDAEQWLAVLRDEASDSDREKVLADTSAELDQFLTSRPTARQDVLEILSRRLEGEIDDTTWDSMEDSLVAYLGAGPTLLLRWTVLTDLGDHSRLAEFERHASPQAAAFVRGIVSAYGPELRNAFSAWMQMADDWKTFFRDVYLDTILQTFYIRVRLGKYSGEEVRLDGTPDSFLNLASNIVSTLQFVGTAEAFSEEARDLFQASIDDFLDVLGPETDEGGGNGAAAK